MHFTKTTYEEAVKNTSLTKLLT